MSSKCLSTPLQTTEMPKGIPYIIGNEFAERFSFYGMKGILVVFMTQYLLDSSGNEAFMGEAKAKEVYHLFTAAAYFFPILGALLSDIVLGKFWTIITLSMGYCLGHACLSAMDVPFATALLEPEAWLFIGMGAIAIGAGGIKPCVSAHVGDQFGSKNQHLVSKTFSWFYFSINVGASTSMILTPLLLKNYGPWLAFGLPGVLMALATLFFWLGRHVFVHIPPGGLEKFKKESFSTEGIRSVLNLMPLFLIFIAMFWAIFDQAGSAWVLQAQDMDRNFLGFEWLEAQVQAVNPVMILILIPFFAYGIYPFLGRFFKVTPLRKIGIGLFLCAAAFAISGWIQLRIDAGETPSIGWQFFAYFILTSSEVLVSITGLEFAYTQAPKKMKSFIMGMFFLGVSFGNLFAAGVNRFIQNEDGTVSLEGADYYWFFTKVMGAVAVIFIFYSRFYKGGYYVQGENDGRAEESAAA
ncbi:MAG: POT family MFS transporter [Planctomycetota bacterium]